MTSPNITIRPDPKSLDEIRKALDAFEIKTQDAIARKALRNYSKSVARLARSLTPSASGVSDKSLAYKVKMNPSGVAWSAVGYKTTGRPIPKQGKGGRALRKVYDSYGSGWRSHFTELGFHSYPVGRQSPYGGLGWKRGQYHRGTGRYRIGTFATIKAQQVLGPTLLRHLQAALYEADQKAKGAKVNRKQVRIILEGGA